MWNLIVRSPVVAPVEYELKPGKNSLGRKPDNQIMVPDTSASRNHAEIYCENGLAVITDLKSTNGTFVNRERIDKPIVLKSGDQIRIGQHLIDIRYRDNNGADEMIAALSGTRPFTRDLLLESIDQHAILMDVVASQLTMILDRETALGEIAKLTRKAVGADRSGVVTAEQFDTMENLELPGKIIRQAIDLRSIVIIPRLSPPPEEGVTDLGKLFIGPVLCVPIMIDAEISAVIFAYKTDPAARPFDEHDVQLAVAISHQGALTIQRAKLIEESRRFEQLASIDSLTGLNNRRQVLSLADLEFQRARRFQHPLSVLVLDLDGLKQINDTYGHLVGDKALTTVAEQCRNQTRVVDCIGRLGGDEFLVLLVETDLRGGLAAAARILELVASTQIDTPQGPLGITISIGVASNDETCSNLTDLLAHGDEALLRAKKNGKNQVLASGAAVFPQ